MHKANQALIVVHWDIVLVPSCPTKYVKQNHEYDSKALDYSSLVLAKGYLDAFHSACAF